jgi:hypothetical protein
MKFSILAFFISFNAFSIEKELPEFVDECKEVAMIKLRDKASTLYNADLDEASVELLDIDNRPLTPSRYVWFKAVAHKKDNNDQVLLQVMTQKMVLPLKKPCF